MSTASAQAVWDEARNTLHYICYHIAAGNTRSFIIYYESLIKHKRLDDIWAWSALPRRFEGPSDQQSIELIDYFKHLRLRPLEDSACYMQCTSDLRQQIEYIDEPMTDRNVVSVLTHGFPAKYTSLKYVYNSRKVLDDSKSHSGDHINEQPRFSRG